MESLGRHLPPGRRRRHPARHRRLRAIAPRNAARDRREPARPPLRRRSRGPGIGTTVIRESGDIDVHIVTHAAAGDAVRASPGHRRGAQPAAGRARLRRGPGRRTAPHLAAVLGPHTRVDHLGGARVPAARRGRGARRRHLAGALRGRAVGADPRLPLRRPAVHRRGLRSAAPVGALPLRRDRAAGQLHRRQGRAAGAHRTARRRRGRAARDGRGQRAARRERRARTRDPGARGVRSVRGPAVDADGTVLATDGEPVRDGRFVSVPVGRDGAARARRSNCTAGRWMPPNAACSTSSSRSSAPPWSAPN